MKKLLCVSTVVFMLFTFAGCSGGTADTGGSGPSVSLSDLKGTWVKTLPDGTDTITFNDDMTYNKVIDLTSYPPMRPESGDTYELDGSTLKIHYSDFGTVSEYKITISGTTMTWDNGATVQEYRKK